jgi:hypothetical protein
MIIVDVFCKGKDVLVAGVMVFHGVHDVADKM